MIIGFFIKNFRTILDALIVAALIVAFSFWDPFGWFGRKAGIKDTPVSLRSVREIGQLVTAEYYGEVVASLKESMISDFSDTAVQRQADQLYRELLGALVMLKAEDEETASRWFTLTSRVKQGNIDRKFGNRFEQITANYLYYPLVNFLWDTLSAQGHIPASTEKENQVLWYHFSLPREQLHGLMQLKQEPHPLLAHFAMHYLGYRSDSLRSEKIKKEIIYIGRGWVKAGIDFGSFSENNLWYDHTSQTIYFRDFEPRILDADINPWYIPEEKIKGFELVVATGKIRDPFGESKLVKLQCKEKLRLQAMHAGILKQARENARASLLRLFSLLMDGKVKQVVFTSNKYKYILREVGADSLIDIAEAQMLDSLIRQDEQKQDTAWYKNFKIQLLELRNFCFDLKKLNYRPDGHPFGYYDLLLAGMHNDGILRQDEIRSISEQNALFITNRNYFDLKQQLFGYLTADEPEFGKIYDFLKTDSTVTQYLGLDRDSLFSVNMRTQYRLSSTRKAQFRQLALDSIAAVLPADPVYPLLFWFDDKKQWETALLDFNLRSFALADSVMMGVQYLPFTRPSPDTVFTMKFEEVITTRQLQHNADFDTLFVR